MQKFEKLMKKKMEEGRGMSDHEMEAKKSVLEHVRQLAQDMMKDKLDSGLKKVSVASDSPEGLEEGLEHAKSLVHGSIGDEEHNPSEGEGSEEQEAEEDMHESADEDSDEESPYSKASDHADEESAEREQGGMGDEDDEAELDRKLAELMAKKKKLELSRK